MTEDRTPVPSRLAADMRKAGVWDDRLHVEYGEHLTRLAAYAEKREHEHWRELYARLLPEPPKAE